MSIHVTHSLGDLEADLRAIAVRVPTEGPRIVRRNTEEGNRLARQFARERGGPHGSNYYKRISGEMTGPLQGEFGPSAVEGEQYVGAGYRHSAPNMDLPDAADIVGPKFAGDVRDMLDGMFWP